MTKQRWKPEPDLEESQPYEGKKIQARRLINVPAVWVECRYLPSRVRFGDTYVEAQVEAQLPGDAQPEKYVIQTSSKYMMADLREIHNDLPCYGILTQDQMGKYQLKSVFRKADFPDLD